MKNRLVVVAASLLGALLTTGLVACNSPNREKAREDAHKTATEIKAEAHELRSNVDAAIKPDGRSASEKLETAREKFDQAALLAKVKTKLAADVGATTLTNISVTADGSVVTLAGSVANADQKNAAEHSASQVDGVTRVNNQLTVQP